MWICKQYHANKSGMTEQVEFLKNFRVLAFQGELEAQIKLLLHQAFN